MLTIITNIFSIPASSLSEILILTPCGSQASDLLTFAYLSGWKAVTAMFQKWSILGCKTAPQTSILRKLEFYLIIVMFNVFICEPGELKCIYIYILLFSVRRGGVAVVCCEASLCKSH